MIGFTMFYIIHKEYMFLFESSKEKAIRQDVEKSMETCISNPKKYNEAKEILAVHLRGSEQKVIEMIVDNVKATIKNEDFQPVRKYQAMLLLKDLMLTRNKALGKYVVKKILKRLTILAQHKSGSKEYQREQDRGKDIFGQVKKDQEQFSVRFFNTLLTALQEWGKNWPKAADGPFTDFHREYNDLLMNGVQFPKQRPKQLSVSKTGGRPSREQVRASSLQQVNTPVQQQKPKREEKSPPPQAPTKSKPSQNSKINSNLRNDLDKFFENTKEPLQLLISLLPEVSAQQLPVIRDIIGQIEKIIEAGNEFVISIQGDPSYKTDDLKLQKCFDFVTKVQKDLRILTKKPEQLQAFRNKYTKLSNQLLQTLIKNRTSKSISPSKVEQEEGISNISKSPPPRAPTPVAVERVQEKPKIKNQNRYASVQGNQVLEHFGKNAPEFQSNSGQSVNSDRFGSFGGPGGGATQRHRASIPIQQNGSPQLQKGKPKPNSDRKQTEKKPEKNNQIPIITEQKTLELSKQQFVNQSQNKPVQKKLELQSEKLFKQFQVQKKQSEKGSVRNVPNFEDNNSFGVNNFEKPQAPPVQEEDFFAKLEQNQKAANKDVNHNPRRKKNHHKEDNQDFFNAKIHSQIDSSKLSGFQFSQKGPDGSRNESRNVPNVPNPLQFGSKKNVAAQDPFELNLSQQDDARKSLQASNFFDKFDPNKSNSEDFFKSTVTQKIKTENQQSQLKLPPPSNPFATGNFGNMGEDAPSPINPFDAQSVKSKKEIITSNGNPFGNESFERVSKRSGELKNSVHSSRSQQSRNENNDYKLPQNPFESKVLDPNDPFGEKLNTSKNNVADPFQVMTQRSNKNPFDQVQDFFKPGRKPSFQGMSERNSFKNIETERKNKILGGNLGQSHLKQPIRDSLVLSAKIDKDVSQYGLNFSQLQDIGEPKQQNNPMRSSDPFNVSGPKLDPQFSGFSLSNFPGIGQAQPQANSNQKQAQLNGSAADFFANFQKQRQSQHSKRSKKASIPFEKPIQKQSEKIGFEDFNMGNSFQNGSKQDNKKSINNINNFVYERQKTVMSGEDKSYNFDQLDKVSAIQKKHKENEFDVFTQWGKTENNTKRSVKQGFQFDNKSQKQEYSWGDFDKHVPNDQINEKVDSKSNRQQNDAHSNTNRSSLEVESRVKVSVSQTDRQDEPKESTSKINKVSNENSIQLNLEDFAPVSKKGIQWNPLGKIANLKASPYTYNVDDRQIEIKKLELLEKQREYNEKMQIFKFARHKNQEIRNVFLQKMKKVEDVIHQKGEFQQILKKLKETNGLKQNQISDIHMKIKRASELKSKILQKQKQFYEITKNQIYAQQKKGPAQRSMSSKWQMFNKNLEHNRNSMYTMHSQYSNGY